MRYGFIAKKILTAMEFEKVYGKVDDMEVNKTEASKNVGKNEILIRLIKERAIIVVSKLSFKTLHKQVVFSLVYFLVMWLNSFTETQGISDKNSKR